MNILVCDDDKEIVEAISIYLSQEGYTVIPAYNGEQAVKLMKEQEIHLVIMDIMMPVMDGTQALMKIRKISNVPVIMLTAKSEDMDKILGLNAGADDYVTKPFVPLELIARVKSQLRRYTRLGGMVSEVKPNVLVNGDLILDDEKKLVTLAGETLKFTPTEYKILHLLMLNPKRVFSSSDIYEKIWGEDGFGSENIVAVHIRRIREKIEIDTKKPKYIKVMWGVGYCMEKLD